MGKGERVERGRRGDGSHMGGSFGWSQERVLGDETPPPLLATATAHGAGIPT